LVIPKVGILGNLLFDGETDLLRHVMMGQSLIAGGATIPRRFHVIQLRNIVYRLPIGHPAKAIHREPSKDMTLIRTLQDLALAQGVASA
jgi:hypothetical protein